MVGVYDLGREHRQDLLLKIFLYILLLRLFQFLKPETAYTIRRKLFFQICISPVTLFVQRRHRTVDRRKLLGRSHAGFRIPFAVIHSHHIAQTPHADHEKFIQITCKYGDKFHPLHQRDALVTRLLQHPLVKPQPGQLPVLCIVWLFLYAHLFPPLLFSDFMPKTSTSCIFHTDMIHIL